MVCIIIGSCNLRLPIWNCRLWPPPVCPGLSDSYHLVHQILTTTIVFSPDGIHQTLHHWIECFCSILFHRSIMVCIFTHTRAKPHLLVIPIQVCKKSQHAWKLQFEWNSSICPYSASHIVCLSCTNKCHHISHNSMMSVTVGHYLMVSLWMLRYHMTQGGYSIGFLAYWSWCCDLTGWDQHFLLSIRLEIWNWPHLLSCQWHSWIRLPLWVSCPPQLVQELE